VSHDVNEPISPELVLVDPDLAARVRPYAVPSPPHAPATPLVRAPAPDAGVRPPDGDAGAAVPERREPQRRIRLAPLVTALAGAAFLGAAFLPPREQPRITDITAPATAAPPSSEAPQRPSQPGPAAPPVRTRPKPAPATPPSPGQAEPGTAPPPVRARPEPTPATPPSPVQAARPPLLLTWLPTGADYYLVEVFSGQRLVFATTLRRARMTVPSWLEPGRYTWRVHAGTGRPAARDVRRLENGWFRVAR
jgi:hypothetical protein